jgi:hypothetical protein
MPLRIGLLNLQPFCDKVSSKNKLKKTPDKDVIIKNVINCPISNI